MSVGLESRFNILSCSPLDLKSQGQIVASETNHRKQRLVASRYNIHSTTPDGKLIVWNTLTGSISTFDKENYKQIKKMLRRSGCEDSSATRGIVAYLKKRGFLVPEGSDEYRLFQMKFGRQHYRDDVLELILLASEDCNFRCEYCYEDFKRGTMAPAVRESVKKLVRRRAPHIKGLSIAWFGGEPLYGWDAIEDLAPYCKKIAEEFGLHYYSNMTTNGYLLEHERAKKLLKWGVRHYQVTVDGLPCDHDQKRPTREGGGTFSRIFDNLKTLRDFKNEDFVMDLRVNFDRDSCDRLDGFIEMVGGEFGGDSRFKLRLRSVGRWGGENDDNLNICEKDKAKETSYRLIRQAGAIGVGSCDDLKYINRFGGSACYASRPFNFIIGANGQIMKCTVDLDKKDRNIIGYLDRDGHMSLDQIKLSAWTEPAFDKDKGCQKCVVLPVCQGISCPQIRMDEDRSPCIPQRSNAKRDLLLMNEFGKSAKKLIVKI